MMKSNELELNLFDEKGELIPLEELQDKVANLYSKTKEVIDENETSSLGIFTDPELQIDTGKTIETFSFLDRSLYLCSEIEHDHATAFSDAIRFWNKVDELDNIPVEERGMIKIYIDSPGGDIDATLSIIDTIMLSKTPVETITIGSGDSGGFFIGLAGHKRVGYPHSSYLFHEGWCSCSGDAHKYFQSTDFYKKKLSMLKKFVLDRTKFTENDYDSFKKDDLWLTAEEALKYGVIGEIATELK